jgi:protein disulfide-isomerase A6
LYICISHILALHPFLRQLGFPTIKIFPAKGKGGAKYPQDYQGERSARAIVDQLVKMLPNNVQLVSANPSSEKIINIDELAADTVSFYLKEQKISLVRYVA